MNHLSHITPTCKICLEDIELYNKSSYITPCLCKGTVKFIHPLCLLQYLQFQKNDTCGLCMSSITFVRWKHSFVFSLLSFILYCFVYLLYFNIQLSVLFTLNYPTYSIQTLIFFKFKKPLFVLLDIWITSSILIVLNLILNHSPQLNLTNPKTILLLPILALRLTYQTFVHRFNRYFINKLC